MKRHVLQFVIFLLAVTIGTSWVYHALNRGTIVLKQDLREQAPSVPSKSAPEPERLSVAPPQKPSVREGLTHDAVHESRKILSGQPDDRSARLGLARALARSGRFAEAVIEYRILLGE